MGAQQTYTGVPTGSGSTGYINPNFQFGQQIAPIQDIDYKRASHPVRRAITGSLLGAILGGVGGPVGMGLGAILGGVGGNKANARIVGQDQAAQRQQQQFMMASNQQALQNMGAIQQSLDLSQATTPLPVALDPELQHAQVFNPQTGQYNFSNVQTAQSVAENYKKYLAQLSAMYSQGNYQQTGNANYNSLSQTPPTNAGSTPVSTTTPGAPPQSFVATKPGGKAVLGTGVQTQNIALDPQMPTPGTIRGLRNNPGSYTDYDAQTKQLEQTNQARQTPSRIAKTQAETEDTKAGTELTKKQIKWYDPQAQSDIASKQAHSAAALTSAGASAYSAHEGDRDRSFTLSQEATRTRQIQQMLREGMITEQEAAAARQYPNYVPTVQPKGFYTPKFRRGSKKDYVILPPQAKTPAYQTKKVDPTKMNNVSLDTLFGPPDVVGGRS